MWFSYLFHSTYLFGSVLSLFHLLPWLLNLCVESVLCHSKRRRARMMNIDNIQIPFKQPKKIYYKLEDMKTKWRIKFAKPDGLFYRFQTINSQNIAWSKCLLFECNYRIIRQTWYCIGTAYSINLLGIFKVILLTISWNQKLRA